MIFLMTMSDQLYKWSDKHERKNDYSSATQKNNTHKELAAFRGDFARIFNRTIQALRQAWMQVRRITRTWAKILFVGQQAQAEAGNGLYPLNLSSPSKRIFREFSQDKNNPRRDLRNQPRTIETKGKTVARPPPHLRWSLLMVTNCIDIQELAILLANMLESAMRCHDEQCMVTEAHHERQDSEKPSAETGLHLPASIQHKSSPPQPGKHRTPVCSEGQSHQAWLADTHDPYFGWGFGTLWNPERHTPRFSEFSGIGLNEKGRSGFCPGSLKTVKIMHGLAPSSGALCLHGDTYNRRRWMLQSLRLQRPVIIGSQRNHVPGGITFPSRAPPGWKTQ